MSARTSVGETPSIVTRSDSISFQMRSAGKSGAPSAYTTVAPHAPPPTTVHGPMIQPMSVAKWMRSPGLTFVWYATSRAIDTRKPPWTCSAPFGLPVVPDVYASRYGCSESTCFGARSPDVPSTSSSQKRSRPSVIGTSSRPRRRQTTVCVTVAADSSASSAICFIGTICPRRSDPSAVISALAFASASRAAIAGAAKPEKIGHLNGAEVRAGVRGDRDLRRHRQEDPDRVALADADRREPFGEAEDLVGELAPRQRDAVRRPRPARPRPPARRARRPPTGGRSSRRDSACRP